MDEEKYKKCIEFAKTLVQEQPEPFKTESFKIILSKLLDSDISTKKSLSSTKSSSTKTKNKKVTEELTIVDNQNEAMSSLADELGIELDQLKDTISINGNKIEIISSIIDASAKQKMIKAALVVLLLSEKLYNSEWVSASIITEKLRETGIHDPGKNLSTHLKNESGLFRFRGNNVNREYKLTTTNGRKKAFEILKELAVGK
jgi:hypothetical protein